METSKSIYGGGRGANVEGNSTVTVTLPNTADKMSFNLENISASGTDKNGVLADNVTGADKRISIASKDDDKTGILQLGKLTGFDSLTLGNTNAQASNNSVFKVSKLFDSNATDTTEARTGRVILNASALILNGNYQGHIGSMEVNGTSALSIHKEAKNDTRPLLVDETVSLKSDQKLKHSAILTDESTNNEAGDVIVRFKDAVNAKAELDVEKAGTDIRFKDPNSHTVESYVEYPVNASTNQLEGNADTTAGTSSVKKVLHFEYQDTNTDSVRTGDATKGGYGGYVIAVPKDLANKEDADSVAKQKLYTTTDDTFRQDGTFRGDLFTNTDLDLKLNVDYWPITFTEYGEANPETGVKAAEGVTEAITIDNEHYWYVAHVVCDGTLHHTYTTLVDTNAPKQVTSATSNEVTVDELGMDTSGEGSYEYTFTVKDPTVNDVTNLTPYKDNDRMEYAAHGIRKVFWTIADGNGDKAAETEAAKRTGNAVGTEGAALKGEGTISQVGNDQNNIVDEGQVAKVKIKVPKSMIEAAKKETGTQYIWAYIKDGVNNTVKLMISLNEDVINVKVPLKVNVVAVKKANEKEACELLAPTCYVVNEGEKSIKVEVNGFNTTAEADNLKLSEDKTSYTASEIALQLLPENGGNAGKKTNVLTINKNPLSIGTMGGTNSTSEKNLKYTFEAAYNVTEIKVPNSWISNTMSYHFTVDHTNNN